jgi:hypothetical protein
LYVVSAREEFPAFPGAAEGGSTPLLAAESIEDEAREAESTAGFLLSAPLPQEYSAHMMHAKETISNFFIKKIFC